MAAPGILAFKHRSLWLKDCIALQLAKGIKGETKSDAASASSVFCAPFNGVRTDLRMRT